METLRVTFLSSLVLELLATVSVAMVAVAIGMRLQGGDMGFRAGLFVLVLAPEAYLPLRRLGGELPRERRRAGRGAARFRRDRRCPSRPARAGCAAPDLAVAPIAVDDRHRHLSRDAASRRS